MSNKDTPPVAFLFDPGVFKMPPSDAKLSHVQRSEVMALTNAIKELKSSIDKLTEVVGNRHDNGTNHSGFNFNYDVTRGPQPILHTAPLFPNNASASPFFETTASGTPLFMNGTATPYPAPTQ